MKRRNPKDYWNDVEVEKGKAFYVSGPEDLRLLRYLREETYLERCFMDAVRYSEEALGGIGPDVLDVASGVCWTSAILSMREGVRQVTAIDYSSFRLFEIAPFAIGQLGGDPDRIKRIHGDFMEMDFPPGSFDTVVFCQALYMFDNIEKVLGKVESVLRPGGRLIISAERLNAPSFLSGDFLMQVFSDPKGALWALAKGKGLKPGADETGRCFYRDCDYKKAIERSGLRYHLQMLPYKIFGPVPVNAGNYFGVKRALGHAYGR